MADIESDEEGAVVASEIPEVTQQEIEQAPGNNLAFIVYFDLSLHVGRLCFYFLFCLCTFSVAPAQSSTEEVPEKLGDNDDESPSIWQRIKDLFPCLRYSKKRIHLLYVCVAIITCACSMYVYIYVHVRFLLK